MFSVQCQGRGVSARPGVVCGRGSVPFVWALCLGATLLGNSTGLTANEENHDPEQGQRVLFDSQMLFQGTQTPIDTSRFEHPGYIAPGKYLLDLWVSGQWRALQEIEFRASDEPQGSQPCFDRSLLQTLGIDLKKADTALGTAATHPLQGAAAFCGELDSYIPGASSRINIAEQKIELSVPQYFLQANLSKTYVDPASWDPGISAAVLNYNSNLFSSQSRGQSQTHGYAGLNLGLNVGALRLRHSGTATWSPELGGRYQRGYIYAQTELPDWHSQLLVGESVTDADLFDSVSFRGVQLASDSRMLPDTQRYYAPQVRGTANSNAKVSVYQRGYLIYETSVAPGPFEISDLQAASFGGDLEVTVTEANGQVSRFTVPFATTVQLLRPGTSRYSLTLGQVTDPGLGGSEQYVAQGTLHRGLDNQLTGYVGTALTGSYMSALIGSALNTSVGAFALDLTQARTELPGNGSLQGSSLRLSYSKNLPVSGTQFSLLAYRYSTSGFLGLHDAIAVQDYVERGAQVESFSRVRDRLDVNINQQLGKGGGQLYVTGSSLKYWNRQGQALNFSLGYGNQWRGNSYSFMAQRMRATSNGPGRGAGADNTYFSFSLSIPLGRAGRRGTTVNAYASHDRNSGAHYTSGISGALDQDGNATYAVSASHDQRQRETSTNASFNYFLPEVSLSSSFSQGSDYRQQSLGASGGMVLHQGGLTFSQTLSETSGLVYAPHAKGARVGYAGTRVDERGYAVVPSLSPYQLNTVDIDPNGIADDVELQVSSRNVAPLAGAVVRLNYPTRRARAFLIDSRQPNGQQLPFAALAVEVSSGVELGAVGQGSRLVLRSEQDQGTLRVEWGHEPGQQCLIDYRLPPRDPASASSYELLQLPCRAVPPGDADSVLSGSAADA
ncbi:outer membrane usher protein CupB3 [Pseudomonas sp. Os17]|uniref:Fimbrial biogenesis outer membrane usher protein n=2 Tax=Pseudomonas TaxID=286 RepID=A0A2T6GNV8_9PSED|nr:fimbrial biogenesis outer membrane usher protein [Pseudomonas protegens]RXU69833.1 fimbrial biogenesis outer membrane usher protein [Pseudomonas protegens]BAQ73176.1 outer membrane usher protein CupB3 [Pseudomonas sp. Os17]